MKNTVIVLAFAAALCAAMLGAVSAVERARHPVPALKPVNLDSLDFWKPTMNELAETDPAGFEALPRPGEPGFEEAVDGWCWRTRQTIFQQRYGREYGGLPQETR